MGWRWQIAGVALGLVLIQPAQDTAAQDTAAQNATSAFVGSFLFSRSTRERTALRTELDRVADQLDWIIRGIARGRLHDEIRPAPRIDLARIGGMLRVRIGERTPISCDGRSHPVVGSDDQDGRATCQLRSGRIVVRSVFDEAVMTDVLTVANGGRAVRLSVTIAAEALPDTIRFQLTYRRSSTDA